jgi:hypothetical protein
LPQSGSIGAPKWQPPIELSGARQFQANIAPLAADWYIGPGHRLPEILVSIAPDPASPGNWLASTETGAIIGRITSRSKMGTLLQSGLVVIRGTVNSFGDLGSDKTQCTVRVRLLIGPPGSIYTPPPPNKIYTARVVGEQYHAAALARCRVGDRVTLQRETGNPFDPHALAVVSPADQVIGHIAKDNWLRRAIVEDGKGCDAQITGFYAAPGGHRKVNVAVVMNNVPPLTRPWRAASPTADPDGSTMPVAEQWGWGLFLALILSAIALAAWLSSR